MTDHLLDPALAQWATPRQVEYLDAVNLHGGLRAAARALGVGHDSVRMSMVRLRTAAALKGYSPPHDMVHTVPDPFKLKGTSTLYGKDGEQKLQWVKTTLDQERYALAQQAALEAMAEELPRLGALEGPAATSLHLLNLYTMTDCHVGMLAWRKEGGADWDLRIAEDILTRSFEQMILSSPAAHFGFVNQLGDFLHTDGMVPITPTSGNVLDADGRFSKMVGVAIRVLRRIIDMALMKHDEVIVLLAEGNHDMASSIWLRHMFKALYENEPRVHVIDSELPYYAWQHGKTMLAFHHGHLTKPSQFVGVFAPLFAPMWGSTTKRYAHAGHRHHLTVAEDAGMTVTQHPTLAARDAYAARGGYFAERAATSITYHDVWGQVASNTICPEMLEEAR